MKGKLLTKKAYKNTYIVFTALLLIVVMVVLVLSAGGLADNEHLNGAQTLKNNIQKAVVLCYATEGFYPPTLKYIEKNYRVVIDRDKYSVWYEVFAQNIPPVVKVVER